MSSRLDILGVEAFVSIVEMGSFRAAARHLHLSESALGRRLKKLEESLGRRLIFRTTRTISLSPDGAEFLPRAQQVVQDLAAALHALRAGDGQPADTVKLGCLPAIAAYWSPRFLSSYARDFPQVKVRIFDRSAREIRAALLEGEVDFGVTLAGPPDPMLRSELLFAEQMVAVCATGHRLGRRKSIGWGDLADEPLISIGRLSTNRKLIEEFALKHSIALSWAYHVEHLATALSLVTAGGVAILPATTVAGNDNSNRNVMLLQNPVLCREIVVLKRKLPLAVPAQALLAIIKDILGDWQFRR